LNLGLDADSPLIVILLNSYPYYNYQQKKVPELPGHHILPPKAGQQSGFMFWSVAISPPYGNNPGAALVWDSARRVVQARYLTDISKILWEKHNIAQGDCLTVIPDKGQVYMTDYNFSPDVASHWMAAVSSGRLSNSNRQRICS
jgi:hypothetical protein